VRFLVPAIFASVAGRYDLMNDAMSLGIHRLWKDALIDWLAPRRGMKLLDVAGGTGDIAFRFLRRLKGQGHATVLDMTEDMLAEGRRRAEAGVRGPRIDWVAGDAMALLSRIRRSTPAPSPSASQRHPHRGRDRRGAPGARAGRPPGPRVQRVPEPGCAGSTTAIRSTSSPASARRSWATATATATWWSRSAVSPTRRPSPR
jgi:hypothetical protein